MSWFRRYITDLSTQRLRFNRRPVYVGFVVDRWALVQGFSKYLGFLLSISFHRCPKLIRSAVTDAVKSRALTASLSNTYAHIDTHIGCGIVHLNTDFCFFFFSLALRHNAGHGLLILEVSRSHTTVGRTPLDE